MVAIVARCARPAKGGNGQIVRVPHQQTFDVCLFRWMSQAAKKYYAAAILF